MKLKNMTIRNTIIGAAGGAAIGTPMGILHTGLSVWSVFNSWWLTPAVYTVTGAIAYNIAKQDEKENDEERLKATNSVFNEHARRQSNLKAVR